MRPQLPVMLTLFAALLATADISPPAPHFSYTRAAKLLLNWDDIWEVGDSRSIAVLKAGSRITAWIRVTGDTGVGMRRMLSFKCPRAAGPDVIDLDSITVGSTGVTRCPDSLPFEIARNELSVDKFVLKIGESKLAISEVFKEALEMQVRIEFSTGHLTSQPLSIWSLDSISPPASASSNAETVNPGPLTANAVRFATSIGSNSDSFTSIDFLNTALVAALEDAPAFFQSKLNFGMILYFHASSCVTYQLSSTILLTNYHSKMNPEQNFGKLAYLNLKDGKLWYSTCGLSRGVKKLYDAEKPTLSIGICSITSLTGDAEPYVNTGSVRPRVLINELSYQGCNITTLSPRCEVVPNVKASIIVISGMDNTAIVCPIICNDLNTPYRFYKDDKLLIGSPSSEWSLVEGVRVSKTGNIVEFPPTVSAAHSGTYRCEAGTKEFSYHVRVVSLPYFIAQSSSPQSGYGLLPEKVFAMEGESLAYSCTVNFASLNSVKVTPAFYMPLTVSDKLNWVRLNDAEFRQKVDASMESLTLTTIPGNTTQTLRVSVARVPSPNPSLLTNFTHSFECVSSVDSSESQLAGISEFSLGSARSNVIFVPRFTAGSFDINPNNNCSIQRCLLSTGAFFEFRLSNKIVNQLKGMGIELQAYLKLDSLPLSNMAALFRDNASTLEVDSANGRLGFRIHPGSSREMMSELLRGRSLTAVFNLRYRSGIDLGSLQIRKNAYGHPSPALGHLDCRADPLCFYSTDFDLDSLGGFLSVPLKFQRPPEPPSQLAGASAYAAGALIVALLLIVALGIIVYLVSTRQTEHTYAVEEIEVKQGYNPQQEARAEVFGEYQRPSYTEGVWQPMAPGDQLSLISGLSETTEEPTHIEDDIDYREYGEEGSFIGNYKTDTKRRELPDTYDDANVVGANNLHF